MQIVNRRYEKMVHRKDYSSMRGIIDLILEIPEEMRGTPMIEIGSFIGESTCLFSMFFSPIYSVDPLGGCPEAGLPGGLQEKMYLKNIEGRNILLHKTTGTEAYAILPGGVSFVYIDALHDYKSVKEDIINFWPKIKENGFIGGHDYGLRNHGQDGVEPAVKELLGEPDMLFCDTSWLIKKTSERMLRCTI